MPLTLLQTVQRAQAQLGIKFDTTTVMAAQDDTTMQMGALMQMLGEELMTERDWTALQSEAIINVVVPITVTGTTTASSDTVTVSSSAGLAANLWFAQGTNIPAAARVAEVVDATTVRLTEEATASGSTTITFCRDTYSMPVDFRKFLNDTQWDRTNHWQLIGPVSPQQFEWLQSGIVSVGPRRRWRQIDRAPYFRIWPPPSADNDAPATLAYEYLTYYWVTAADGTPKAAYTLDTDLCVFPDDVMVTGLKLKFYQAKLFDTTHLMREHQMAKDKSMAGDGGAATLNMGARRFPMFVSPANVQDGNWPGRA